MFTPSGRVSLGPGMGVNWPEFVFSVPDVGVFKMAPKVDINLNRNIRL
jgi:hypothetical protein